MGDKKYSLDDILLEVGLSSAPEKEDPVDVDALLQNIVTEKQSLKTEEAPSFVEPPTKEFTPAKKVEPGTAPQAAPRKPLPVNPAPEPKREEILPASEPVVAGSPLENSGNFSIDIEGIRQEHRPPEMSPPESPGEEERPEPPEIHFNQKKEEPDFERRLDFAPCFRKFEETASTEHQKDWEALLLKEKTSSTVRGTFLLLMAVASLILSMMIYLNAATGIGFIPTLSFLLTAGGIGIISGVLGFPVLMSGVRSVLKLEPNRDIMPTVAYAFCMIQYFTQLAFPKGLSNPNIHQYLPVGILILGLAFLGRTLTLKTAVRNLRTLNANSERYESQIIWDSRAAAELSKGLVDDTAYPVVNRKTDQVSDFMKLSLSMDSSDRFGRNLTLVGTALALVVALFTFLFTKQRHLAVTIMTAMICVFASAVNLYSVCYPLLRCSKKAAQFNGLVSGEKCGLNYGDVNVAVVEAKSLFPPAAVMLNGIKTFEGMRIDEAILDAASVLSTAGSIMTDVFLKIIGNRTELLRKAENLHYEDGMGLSAWIDNRRILIGNRDLMASHNIRVPSLDYERRFTSEGSDLVYLSTSGELTAVFIFTLHPTIPTEEAVQVLYSSDIALSVKTIDSIVTKERLSSLFAIEPNFFKILPSKLSRLYDECSQPVKIRPAVAVNNGSFASMACSVAASKRMKVMMTVAQVVMVSSIILGTLLIAVFGFLGATKQLSPLIMFCYPVIWLIIHFLLQKLIRL